MWNFLGFYFVVAIGVFHTLPELLMVMADPGRGTYRDLVSAESVDNWLLWFGPVPLIYTVTYLAFLGAARRKVTYADASGSAATAAFLGWKQCAVVTLPLYLLAIRGRAYVPTIRSGTGPSSYLETGFTAQFLLVGVVFTSFAAIQRFGRATTVLLIQSFALLLIGQRLTVAAGAAMLAFLLKRQGWSATRSERAVIIAAVLVAMITVSSARDTVGRVEFSAGSGPTERLTALWTGFKSISTASGVSALVDDVVSRVDGNAFGAISMERMDAGAPEVGLHTIRNIGLLSIPSAINPAKLETAAIERSEKAYIMTVQRFGYDVDFIPTPFGPGFAYFGRVSLYLTAVGFGMVLAWTDRRTRTNSPIAGVIAVGMLSWILYYERGLEGAAVTMRGILVLAVLLFVARRATSAGKRANRAISHGLGHKQLNR